MPGPCQTQRLKFTNFDGRFLEKSWQWLQDPEIKRLTMTPDFNREQQRRWFDGLPHATDYLIWGLLCDDKPIGAVGLKHLEGRRAEYWGYIGEREYWGAGLGSEMMEFILGEAKARKLRELYLVVHQDNTRAIALYQRHGFRPVAEKAGCSGWSVSWRKPMVEALTGYSVERYSPARKAMWDDFLGSAKNTTFLFRRDYMDYHSDRFANHSLLIFQDNRLAALMPANLAGESRIASHEGLTYGGLVVPREATLCEVLESFHALLRHLHEGGIARLLYKRCPRFYNTLPDDEVDYAFFILEARLSGGIAPWW